MSSSLGPQPSREERVLRAETVAKHAYRLLGETPSLRQLRVNVKDGVCGTVELGHRFASTTPGPALPDDALRLALELREILIRAAADARTTGQIVVNLLDLAVDANLITGPRDEWHAPDLRDPSHP